MIIWSSKFKSSSIVKKFDNVPVPKYYTRCNPSVVKTENGFRTIIRSVNYRIKNDHDYITTETPGQVIHTRNFVVEWDKDWNLLSQKELIDESKRTSYNVFVTGLEDARIIDIGNKHYLSCTSADCNIHGMPQTLLMEWDPKTALLSKSQILHPTAEESRCKEKNWLPFEYNGSLQYIYNHSPLTIHKINLENGQFEKVKETESCEKASKMRGSAGPILYKKGWLYIVHEVTYQPFWNYPSRWVYLNQDFKMESISDLFHFVQPGIEFASGMCWDHNPDFIWVTFGVRDAEAMKIRISVKDIDTVLSLICN